MFCAGFMTMIDFHIQSEVIRIGARDLEQHSLLVSIPEQSHVTETSIVYTTVCNVYSAFYMARSI